MEAAEPLREPQSRTYGRFGAVYHKLYAHGGQAFHGHRVELCRSRHVPWRRRHHDRCARIAAGLGRAVAFRLRARHWECPREPEARTRLLRPLNRSAWTGERPRQHLPFPSRRHGAAGGGAWRFTPHNSRKRKAVWREAIRRLAVMERCRVEHARQLMPFSAGSEGCPCRQARGRGGRRRHQLGVERCRRPCNPAGSREGYVYNRHAAHVRGICSRWRHRGSGGASCRNPIFIRHCLGQFA